MKSRAHKTQQGQTPKTTKKRKAAVKAAVKAASNASTPSNTPMQDLSTTGRQLGGLNEGYTGSGKKLGTTKGLATRRRQGTK